MKTPQTENKRRREPKISDALFGKGGLLSPEDAAFEQGLYREIDRQQRIANGKRRTIVETTPLV